MTNKVDRGVYIVTIICSDGKPRFYVGKATSLRKRERQHLRALENKKHGNVFLQRAWDKHRNFQFSILERCAMSDLLSTEQRWLDSYRKEHGDHSIFNIMKECVDRRLGVPHTDEVRKVLSDRQKLNWVKPEYRSAMISKLKDVHGTPEARARNSERQKEIQNRPEIKIRNAEMGRLHGLNPIVKANRRAANLRPEVRAKRSASIKKALSAPGMFEKRSALGKIIQNRPEVKARLAATNALPEIRAKRSHASTLAQSSPEARQKQREIQLISQNMPSTKEKKVIAVRAALSSPEIKSRIKHTNSLPEVRFRRSIAAKAWRITRAIESAVSHDY